MSKRSRLTLTPLEDRWTPAAGDLDPTFGQGGTATFPLTQVSGGLAQVSAALAQSDGRVVLVGNTPAYDFAAVRLTTAGTADPTFGTNGMAQVDIAGATDFANAAAVQPDGKLILAGSAFVGSLPSTGTPVAGAVVRLTADGRLDPTFGTLGRFVSGGQISQTVFRAVAVQPDGESVVAGSEYDNTTNAAAVRVVRLTADGRSDPGFGDGGVARLTVGGEVAGVVVRPDGRILVVGTSPGRPDGGGGVLLVQLTADGRPDPTFAGGGTTVLNLGENDLVNGVALLPDGRAVLATGRNRGEVVRITSEGVLDPTFGTAGRVTADLGTDFVFRGVTTQPNGRLLLTVSRWRSDLGLPPLRYSAVRLNADGSLDTTFAQSGKLPVGAVAGLNPQASAVLPDGGLLLASASDSAFAAVRLIGDNPPVTPGSVFVGGPPDGTARVFTPVADQLRANVPVTFYPGFAGTVRTALADVNGDGVADLIAGPGPGGGPNVVVYDGKTSAQIADLHAFEATFTGGVFVAAADLNGDGKAEVIVTPDQGGGPVVVIFDGAKLAAGQHDAAQLSRFFGIIDPNFRGGARPALGDVNGDGRPDLLVAAGFGGGPRLAVFNGVYLAHPDQYTTERISRVDGHVDASDDASVYVLPHKLVADFFVFEDTLRNGVFVAAGDLTGDGAAEVVVGGGPGGGPRVFALDGRALVGGGRTEVANFFAGDSASRGGVRVAVVPDATGQPQLVTGSGDGEAARVRVYKPATARAGGGPDQELAPFNGVTLAGGVYVG